MRIAYHYPSLHHINANRTIYNGYKNAFIDLGHKFFTLTADEKLDEFLGKYNPDIFITSSHYYYRKFLDYGILKKYRTGGMKVLTKIDYWRSPIEKSRINEAPSLKDDKEAIMLIKTGLMGDHYYHTVEQGDLRMEGFEKDTGQVFHTIPLAADKIVLNGRYTKKFAADISYVGTNLPQKRKFFEKNFFPLANRYDLKLYGQEWTEMDKLLGLIQKIGQFYNIPILRSARKPKLKLEDEADIYASSVISINVHEEYQKKFGGDCNERTFKIPFCGGFEIVDDVACIEKYFISGKEIIIAKDDDDWNDKVHYYLDNPEKRSQIIKAGKNKVSRFHTYHNRVKQIFEIIGKK